MEAFYKDNHNTIYCLDFRQNELPDESVQMVCTSPPYWGLRKYSGEQELIWGDSNACEHQWGSLIPHPMHKSGGHTYLSDISKGTQDTQDEVRHKGNLGCWCQLCGAWKGAYGLEPTPEMYIQHTIEILREIRRVLRKDGVVFLNIGDSYYGGGTGADYKYSSETYEVMKSAKPVWNSDTLKPKDLCLIPFRIAIAAQEDGWWVRSVIIWSKPNPMPESVTDRPTESHEYLLMLTQSGKSLYWTHPRKGGSRTRPKPDYIWTHKRTGLVVDYPPVSDRILKEFWARSNLWRGHDYYWDADAVREQYTEPMNRWGGETLKRDTSKTAAYKEMQNIGYSSAFRVGRPMRPNPSGRNIRSVWEFPTQPYPEAHFAVFPEKLPELCIKAATPEVGCCSKCGAPWERVLDKKPSAFNIRVRDAKAGRATPEEGYKATQEEIDNYPGNHPDPGYRQTLGWQPTCKCQEGRRPSLVLDPFLGAGTTLWVAKKLNRQAIGYEISAEYCQLGADRCRQQVLI